MKIAFDVDGVVLQSIDVILEYVNMKRGGRLRPEDLTGWDLEPIGLDTRTLHEAVEFMYAQVLVDPYPGAVEVLSRIHASTGEPLLFITGRHRPETALKQLEQLQWPDSTPEMVVIGGDRDKRDFLRDTSAAFIVEDDTMYLQHYLDSGVEVGLMVQPWNRSSRVPVTRRFHGWTDVESWFGEIPGNGGVSCNR
jgi:hypothetical protein